MTELQNDSAIMSIAEKAFLDESGAALIKKYCSFGDELFTQAGYRSFAFDLLERMTNPFLADTIERAGRDPVRKLGYDDRIFGTMRLAIEQGIEPANMAIGALAGIKTLLKNGEISKVPIAMRWNPSDLDAAKLKSICEWLWRSKSGPYADKMIKCVEKAGLQG